MLVATSFPSNTKELLEDKPPDNLTEPDAEKLLPTTIVEPKRAVEPRVIVEKPRVPFATRLDPDEKFVRDNSNAADDTFIMVTLLEITFAP